MAITSYHTKETKGTGSLIRVTAGTTIYGSTCSDGMAAVLCGSKFYTCTGVTSSKSYRSFSVRTTEHSISGHSSRNVLITNCRQNTTTSPRSHWQRCIDINDRSCFTASTFHRQSGATHVCRERKHGSALVSARTPHEAHASMRVFANAY
jgi:hypothetical protein